MERLTDVAAQIIEDGFENITYTVVPKEVAQYLENSLDEWRELALELALTLFSPFGKEESTNKLLTRYNRIILKSRKNDKEMLDKYTKRDIVEP